MSYVDPGTFPNSLLSHPQRRNDVVDAARIARVSRPGPTTGHMEIISIGPRTMGTGSAYAEAWYVNLPRDCYILGVGWYIRDVSGSLATTISFQHSDDTAGSSVLGIMSAASINLATVGNEEGFISTDMTGHSFSQVDRFVDGRVTGVDAPPYFHDGSLYPYLRVKFTKNSSRQLDDVSVYFVIMSVENVNAEPAND